jgi:hypothetical protein
MRMIIFFAACMHAYGREGARQGMQDSIYMFAFPGFLYLMMWVLCVYMRTHVRVKILICVCVCVCCVCVCKCLIHITSIFQIILISRLEKQKKGGHFSPFF